MSLKRASEKKTVKFNVWEADVMKSQRLGLEIWFTSLLEAGKASGSFRNVNVQRTRPPTSVAFKICFTFTHCQCSGSAVFCCNSSKSTDQEVTCQNSGWSWSWSRAHRLQIRKATCGAKTDVSDPLIPLFYKYKFWTLTTCRPDANTYK